MRKFVIVAGISAVAAAAAIALGVTSANAETASGKVGSAATPKSTGSAKTFGTPLDSSDPIVGQTIRVAESAISQKEPGTVTFGDATVVKDASTGKATLRVNVHESTPTVHDWTVYVEVPHLNVVSIA